MSFVGPPVKVEVQDVYFKILLNVAAADGELGETEREWIMDHPQELIDQFQSYQPGTSDEVKKFFENAHLPYLKMAGMEIIFNGLRAAAADGELHAKEKEAIDTVAKKLGISEEQVRQIHALVEEEEKLRQKRAKTLFPQSFVDTVSEFYKHHS